MKNNNKLAIIRMMHNTKDETYHPILYLQSPLPGPYEEGKPTRYKSKFHHTTGFKKREEGMQHIQELIPRIVEAGLGFVSKAEDIDQQTEGDEQWDGEGVPIGTILA